MRRAAMRAGRPRNCAVAVARRRRRRRCRVLFVVFIAVFVGSVDAQKRTRDALGNHRRPPLDPRTSKRSTKESALLRTEG